MTQIVINSGQFNFNLLPEYAAWLLQNRLEEYCVRNLELTRQADLPLLRPLLKLGHEELLEMGRKGAIQLLSCIAANNVESYVRQNLQNWQENKLGVVDKEAIVAEDISLVFSIRRKLFQYFLFEYTSDQHLITGLLNELDNYTTREELLTWNLYNKMQQEKLAAANAELSLNHDLLLEAQSLGDMGSYVIDFTDESKSRYTPQYYHILGISARVGREKFLEWVHADDRGHFAAAMDEVMQNGGELEMEYRYTRKGEFKRIWTRGIAHIENGKVTQLKGTIRDITRKHELLDKLRQSEALHREAQALTHLGNWSWRPEEEHIYWSEELYRIFGVTDFTEVITPSIFLGLVHPEDREKMSQYLTNLGQGAFSEEITFKIVTPGGLNKFVKTISKADLNKEGTVARTYGTCQDITREFQLNQKLVTLNNSLAGKNRELEQLNEELESFNYVASHDLQEPLRKIQIYGNRLLDDKNLVAEGGRDDLQRILSAARRMQNLITDLIEFSQVSSSADSFETVGLSESISEARNNLSEMIADKAAVISVGKLPEIRAIPFHMTQLFTNLIGNAVKYSRSDVQPQVKITARTVKGSEPGLTEFESYLAIDVQDNGIGFDPQHKENIFDLFKRLHTRDKYAGTGIGLAICKKIVLHHDGLIKAESTPGEGSVFTVFLPEGRILRR